MFKQNVKRDALLVHASMNGIVEPLVISMGWTPDVLHQHGKWLRKQTKRYINKVSNRVIELEKNKV